MADDNVTDLGGNNNGQKGKKKAIDILSEIKSSFLNKKAQDFKTKATAKLEEIEKAERVVVLAKLELDKLVEEYNAEVTNS